MSRFYRNIDINNDNGFWWLRSCDPYWLEIAGLIDYDRKPMTAKGDNEFGFFSNVFTV